MNKIDDKLFSFASEVDELTIEQAKQTAAMPFVAPHVALMPDAHFGKGSSVGTVIPTIDAVVPAAVGVDVGCGMIAMLTTVSFSDMDDRMAVGGDTEWEAVIVGDLYGCGISHTHGPDEVYGKFTILWEDDHKPDWMEE